MRLNRLFLVCVCLCAGTLTARTSSTPFGRLSPANGAVGTSTSLLLSWQYGDGDHQYCLDTVDNGLCDTQWISIPVGSPLTSAVVSGLMPETTYYWHVRVAGNVYADGDPARFWSFTTGRSRHAVSQLGGLTDYPSHEALSINASGAVVGSGFGGSASGGPASLAERFDPAASIYQMLVPPYDSATKALSINDSELISGYGTRGSNTAVYAGGGNWLPQLPGGVNQLGGYVNNAGEVVGTTYFDASNATLGHATLWFPDGGGYSALDLGLYNGYATEARGSAPNRSGSDRLIVGRYREPAPNASFGNALQWKDGAWTALTSWCFSVANAVSDSGVIVGQACGRAALWENSQVRLLGLECKVASGSLAGEARAISVTPGGRVLIVGTCGNQPAVCYSDGSDSYICELLELPAGDTQGNAFDVNASGQIVGSTNGAGPTHAVTWTFSEPSPVLTITKTGTGTGSVTSVPAGINCGATCSALFTLGQEVTLIATPVSGSVFTGFGGDIDCHDGHVTMFAARTCTAVFTLGAGGGPISPLYLLRQFDDSQMISVLQGSTVTNSWLTYAATHTAFGKSEIGFAVTDVIKVFSHFPFYLASYSLTGDLLGVGSYTAQYNSEEAALDGASDGKDNYVVTLFDRVRRLDANWMGMNSTLFGTSSRGFGIAHDPSTNTLWLSMGNDVGEIRQYSMAGALLSSFQVAGAATIGALALDPIDSTLWLSHYGSPALQQYSKQGVLLSTVSYPNLQGWYVTAAEFARPPVAPGAFYKVGPTNFATGKALRPVLSWNSSAGATSYEYCIDSTGDDQCDEWINVGTTTSVAPENLLHATTYFWQVRANHAGGPIYADGEVSRFWKFTTAVRSKPSFDLNADGNGDALLYNPSSGNWQRQVSQPNGVFASSNGSFGPGWTVVPATFDDDASSDVFLFNATTGAWAKMLGSGGNFVIESSGSWWNGWQRHVMDLDGDGISDVFLYDPVTGVWFKCISTPTGFTYYQGGWNPDWEIYPMTLNADGMGDMFLFSRTSGRWFWVLGAAGGGFTYPVTDGWFNGWNIYPGHFDSDNLSDLLLHHPATGTWFVAMNNGGGFTYTSGGWSLGWTPYVADLDNDQDDDLFLHDPATGNWFEMLSTGAGSFTNAGGGTWSLGWNLYFTDLNADGRADIILHDPATGVWYQARNFVTGTFTYSTGTWSPGWTVIVRNPSQ
jgi:hypothetical protein